MTSADQPQGEIEALRERLSRLIQASLRITGGLDLDAVLQGVEDAARAGGSILLTSRGDDQRQLVLMGLVMT